MPVKGVTFPLRELVSLIASVLHEAPDSKTFWGTVRTRISAFVAEAFSLFLGSLTNSCADNGFKSTGGAEKTAPNGPSPRSLGRSPFDGRYCMARQETRTIPWMRRWGWPLACDSVPMWGRWWPGWRPIRA